MTGLNTDQIAERIDDFTVFMGDWTVPITPPEADELVRECGTEEVADWVTKLASHAVEVAALVTELRRALDDAELDEEVER